MREAALSLYLPVNGVHVGVVDGDLAALLTTEPEKANTARVDHQALSKLLLEGSLDLGGDGHDAVLKYLQGLVTNVCRRENGLSLRARDEWLCATSRLEDGSSLTPLPTACAASIYPG